MRDPARDFLTRVTSSKDTPEPAYGESLSRKIESKVKEEELHTIDTLRRKIVIGLFSALISGRLLNATETYAQVPDGEEEEEDYFSEFKKRGLMDSSTDTNLKASGRRGKGLTNGRNVIEIKDLDGFSFPRMDIRDEEVYMPVPYGLNYTEEEFRIKAREFAMKVRKFDGTKSSINMNKALKQTAEALIEVFPELKKFIIQLAHDFNTGTREGYFAFYYNINKFLIAGGYYMDSSYERGKTGRDRKYLDVSEITEMKNVKVEFDGRSHVFPVIILRSKNGIKSSRIAEAHMSFRKHALIYENDIDEIVDYVRDAPCIYLHFANEAEKKQYRLSMTPPESLIQRIRGYMLTQCVYHEAVHLMMGERFPKCNSDEKISREKIKLIYLDQAGREVRINATPIMLQELCAHGAELLMMEDVNVYRIDSKNHDMNDKDDPYYAISKLMPYVIYDVYSETNEKVREEFGKKKALTSKDARKIISMCKFDRDTINRTGVTVFKAGYLSFEKLENTL